MRATLDYRLSGRTPARLSANARSCQPHHRIAHHTISGKAGCTARRRSCRRAGARARRVRAGARVRCRTPVARGEPAGGSRRRGRACGASQALRRGDSHPHQPARAYAIHHAARAIADADANKKSAGISSAPNGTCVRRAVRRVRGSATRQRRLAVLRREAARRRVAGAAAAIALPPVQPPALGHLERWLAERLAERVAVLGEYWSIRAGTRGRRARRRRRRARHARRVVVVDDDDSSAARRPWHCALPRHARRVGADEVVAVGDSGRRRGARGCRRAADRRRLTRAHALAAARSARPRSGTSRHAQGTGTLQLAVDSDVELSRVAPVSRYWTPRRRGSAECIAR